MYAQHLTPCDIALVQHLLHGSGQCLSLQAFAQRSLAMRVDSSRLVGRGAPLTELTGRVLHLPPPGPCTAQNMTPTGTITGHTTVSDGLL